MTLDGIFSKEINSYQNLLKIINEKYDELEELSMCDFNNYSLCINLNEITNNKFCSNLKKIKFSRCSLNHTENFLNFLNKCRNLQYLDLSDCKNLNIYNIICSQNIILPQLETLILN